MGLCIGGPLDGQEYEAANPWNRDLIAYGDLQSPMDRNALTPADIPMVRYQAATLTLSASHDARIGYAYPLWLAPGWTVRLCQDGPVPVVIATHPLDGERRYLLATAAACEDASPWAPLMCPTPRRQADRGPSPEAVGYAALVEGDATLVEMLARLPSRSA